MKEILSTAENLFRTALNNRRPELAKEMLIRAFTDSYFHTWELSPEVRYFINGEMIPDMIAGNKRSLGRDAEVMLSGEPLIFKNLERIPKDGPLLVTPNHYSDGPLNGYGTHLGIAMAILRRRGKDIKYILQDSLVNPLTGQRMPLTQEIYKRMTDAYEALKVPPPSLRVKNGESANLESVKAILTAIRAGEAEALYPELTGTRTIQKGHFLAGKVAYSYFRATKGDGLVLPIGVFQESGILSFNFGDPYPVSEMEEFFPKTRDESESKRGNQKAANYMMAKINALVPKRMRNPKLEEMFSQN